jgi:iron complex outermembrane receptor protein
LSLFTGLLSAFYAVCTPVTAAQVDASTNLSDLSVEQLLDIKVERVSGASRYEQEVSRAPASVSVITAEDIQQLGYRSLVDVLQGVRGMYVANDRNYYYIGMRGFGRPGDYNSRILLLVDGHRINDNIYNDPLAGTSGIIDVDLIDRVEVIRGPSSSIYGDSAFLGVINVLTKPGRKWNRVEGSVEVGGYETYKGRFTVGKMFSEDFEFTLSGTWSESAGDTSLYYPEFANAIHGSGVAKDSDQENSESAFASIRWKDFTLSGGWVSRNKEVPTASFETLFNVGMEDTLDERGYVDLRYDKDLGATTHLLARAYYDYYSYLGHYPDQRTVVEGWGAVTQLLVDDVVGDWVGTEWQLTQTIFDRHTLVAGVEYRENLTQEQREYYEGSASEVMHSEESGGNVGLYGQAEIALRTNITLTAGLRYDHYDSFGGTLNPRLGLIYSPWKPTNFKLLYGRAFRAPNVYELYYESPGTALANPHLDPETIDTYEFVWEQQLPANLRLSASAYYYEIRDLITQQKDAEGLVYYANVDSVHAQGLELELEHRFSFGLRTRVGYALQRAEDQTTGEELSNSPRNLAKFQVIAPLYRDKLFTGLEVLYTGCARTLTGAEADDFTIVNWTLFSQNLVKNLDLSASVYNLFDVHYGYPGAAEHVQDIIDQNGLSFRVKLTYHF